MGVGFRLLLSEKVKSWAGKVAQWSPRQSACLAWTRPSVQCPAPHGGGGGRT